MDEKIKAAARKALNEGDDALSDDELLAELENDPELERFREARMEQMKHEINHVRELRSLGHGEYQEIGKEEDIVKLISRTAKGVVHFTHPSFARCKILDKHLQVLAPHHFETRFVSINIEKCPFLAQKFQIRVLPCLVVVSSGHVADRLVGFEEFGNADGFSTEALERRLAKTGVLKIPKGELGRVPVAQRPVSYQIGHPVAEETDSGNDELDF
ncbi:hypothetical protein J3B02_002114 [Coemansia erecta]|uniref:Thioredoxin domain-containing protein n=1 Tax=Coemansia asiatica TaxID=1052880 RepID=A0A9W7XKZ3_9FUNG|nr:hypothetical protein LPJ64_003484 [Coemansia asiatica]KAJ2855526.1 hypothetical protein J3B02_002114 [Coemansia erecta]